MSTENGTGRNRPYRNFRTSLNIGMGIIYILVGIMVVFGNYFGTIVNVKLTYIIGALITLYGIFRLYLGIKGVLGNKNIN